MDEAILKSNPSSRSKERSEKNKLHHGIWQGNAAMRVVVAIGFTFLGFIVGNMLIFYYDKEDVQCKFETGREPTGHKGSPAWDDDQGSSSLHMLYMDEYKSELLLFSESIQKALVSIFDSRLINHAWSTPMTAHGNVGSRYDADFQTFDGVSKGFEEAWLYGVCPSPSSIEYLFQHECCSRWEDPRLEKRELSGRDHLDAHMSEFRSLPDANTPLLGPVSWPRTFFVSDIPIAPVGSVSPLWRLDWNCLDRAITMLPFHKFCEEVIWRRILGTQISDAILILIPVSITEPHVPSTC